MWGFNMRISDFIPILIVITALIVTVTLGICNNIDFSELMIRCMAVTIVFGIFGSLITKTVLNLIEYYRVSIHIQDKGGTVSATGSKLDIKVPPLDDEALEAIDYDSDNEFIEVNPADLSKYINSNTD
jgi:hypothetical protein